MRTAFSLLFFLTSFLGFSQDNFIDAHTQIDSIMRSYIVHEGKRPVHNFMLYAKNKQSGFEVHKGVGIIGRNDKQAQKDFQFKIASITKTFVATVTLQLIEEGKLQLDEKVYPHLSKINYLEFDRFHIYNDTSYAKSITVEQLLRHTSGIADIFTDKDTRFVLSVLTHKRRMYDEKKVVERYFKYRLHKQPTNKPSEGYHYSDMNFMLLGFTIEQVTGKNLAQNIRERILYPLQMKNTYFEYYEPVRGVNQQIDTYYKKLNLTKKVNTSYEWGGGGLVSTVKELGVFIDALFTQKLFKKPETLEMMLDLSHAQKYGKDAGMGIFQYHVNGKDYYGHGGYYGSLLLYNPTDEIIFCANLGQSDAALDPYELVENIVEVVEKN